MQYADDTLFVLQACSRQLFMLKALLNTFAESTGLRVNYSKLVMVPINVSDEKMDILAKTFNCQKGSLPFTYLALPLGLTKPNLGDFIPLINRAKKKTYLYFYSFIPSWSS